MKRIFLIVVLGLSACSSRETLVIYSPHGRDILKDYEEMFEAQHPEIDVLWLDMGSQDVYNRISAERDRPACDVWWGAPSTMFMQASKSVDGQPALLEAYEPSWAGAVDETNKDPGNLWYGTHRTPLAIMFNNRKYTRDDVPSTWDELLSDKWKGRIAIRKPLPSGTMRTFIGAMIQRSESEDEGIAWLKKLHASTEHYAESPQLLFEHLKRNEDIITVWIMPDAVLQRERHGFPFDFFLPPQTPVLTEGIAIVRGAPHRESAEKFYEFVTTPEALAHQAEAYAKIPARNDIDPGTLPRWMVEQPIDAMPMDWQVFAEREKEWCARWEREVFSAR